MFARYLTKSDNGVVAAALIVIALGQLFTDSGFGAAVVQREDLTDDHIRTAFALSLLTGLCHDRGRLRSPRRSPPTSSTSPTSSR